MDDERRETGIPETRRALDALIREHIGSISARYEKPDNVGDEELVMGWFLVVEVMAPTTLDGEATQSYALHTLSCDPNADRDLTPWTAKGYLHQVLDDPANYLSDYDHFAEDDDD